MNEITKFDYGQLGTEARIVVKQKTGEIQGLMRKTAQDIIDIGQKLIEVKEQLPHGAFGPWLEAEFAWTERTARRYISVAEQFKSDTVSDLAIAPSALYLLASPSTPEPARREAIKRAQGGEKISRPAARQVIQDFTPAPKEKVVQHKPKVMSGGFESQAETITKMPCLPVALSPEDTRVIERAFEPERLGQILMACLNLASYEIDEALGIAEPEGEFYFD